MEKNNVDNGYHILTYGCQMNVRDSEIIAGFLEDMGYQADDLETANLVVLNTCSVRHSAENKVFGKLGELKHLKKKRPSMMVAFGGCMAQTPGMIGRLKKMDVDVIFGTFNVHELPSLIEEARQSKRPVVSVWEKHGPIIEPLPSIRNEGVSAFVNVMYGCNNFCSYCIVPYTRGRERSRHPEAIIAEVEHLAALGYKEITLLGQNVNSYGRGLQEKVDFADLLHRINQISGLERIRFMTSHPKDLSERLIDAIAEEDKVCEHIHVAMQSGSNKVLQRMNRSYTRDHFLALTEKIRQRIPDIVLSTDIIVGFPGETEADFLDTLDMVEKIRFEAAFTFMYSVRTGTRAATLQDQVDLETKKDRLFRLNKVQYQLAHQFNKALEGTVQEVLVEGPSKTDPNFLSGRTRGNTIVIFPGGKDLIGRLIHVRITEGKTFSIFGEPIPATS